MLIAISSEDKNGLDSLVSHHFGRCPCYVMVSLQGGMVQAVLAVDNPYRAGHEPGAVPAFIHSQGATVLLCGGIGRRALELFRQYEIEVVSGACGTVRATVESYLAGHLCGAAPCRESQEHAGLAA